MSNTLPPNNNCRQNYELNPSNYYNYLRVNWKNIFPDGNRNAAGAVFFKYILNIPNLSYNDFLEFNKLYCAVSGSLVQSNSNPDFIKIKDLNDNLICGYYYRCCWPCSCDIMKYARVIEVKHKFCDSDNLRNFHVIAIKNPCNKIDFPQQVNRNYFCNDNSINKSNVISLLIENIEYLLIGVLFNASLCTSDNLNSIKNNNITGNLCNQRNNTPLKKLRVGMGDIFINMAK